MQTKIDRARVATISDKTDSKTKTVPVIKKDTLYNNHKRVHPSR